MYIPFYIKGEIPVKTLHFETSFYHFWEWNLQPSLYSVPQRYIDDAIPMQICCIRYRITKHNVHKCTDCTVLHA